MKYIRLYCDENGESRCEDSEFTFELADFALRLRKRQSRRGEEHNSTADVHRSRFHLATPIEQFRGRALLSAASRT